MKHFFKPILLSTLLSVAFATASAQNILPKSFAGWTQTGAETATYTRPDGRKLTVKAAQFKDATGGYGAFTFYRDPAMKSERIGTKAASANERILFFRSN